jgi:hypothetical protein
MTFPGPILVELKRLGWEIYRNEDPDVNWTPERGYILERKTSKGTPTYLEVSEDNILKDIHSAWISFDKDRYVIDIMGDKSVSADEIQVYRKDAFEIKEMYIELFIHIQDVLNTLCDLTIWVNQDTIPIEVVRMMEVLRSNCPWRCPKFDGGNGTVVYNDLLLEIAMSMAKSLKEEFKLHPIKYKIEIIKD